MGWWGIVYNTDWKMVYVNKLINVLVGSFCACNLEILGKNNYYFLFFVSYHNNSNPASIFCNMN